MATKTVTIDTGEWAYPDATGITHLVNNAQTFTFELTDGGAAAVTYQQDHATSVTTTDGLRIYMRPQSEGNLGSSTGTNVGSRRTWGPTADAQNNTTLYSLAGEIYCECPVTGLIQCWKPSKLLVNDVDVPTSITATFEDQYGNSFTWTGVTIS